MGDFEVDTAIEGEAGRYHAVLSEDWDIWGPNGGYLATIALRAAGREAQVQRPSSFSAHFLSVARFAPVDVEVEVLRRGRSTESFRVSVSQQGKPIIVAMVRTAAEGPGLEHDVARAPEVPDPETLASTEELRDPEWGAPYPFWQNLEARPVHPERFKEPPQPRPPTFREWYRFRPRATFEDPFVDAGRQLLLIDTLSWPAACQPHPNAAFRAPPRGSREPRGCGSVDGDHRESLEPRGAAAGERRRAALLRTRPTRGPTARPRGNGLTEDTVVYITASASRDAPNAPIFLD
jgi:acyl-CoA thioesterase-2